MENFKYPEDTLIWNKYNKNYPYKKIIDSISMNKLFSTFNFYSNKGWNGTPYTESDGYLYIDSISPGEKAPISGKDFNYRINDQGFRSKKFTEFDKDKTNILFTGCSITEAVGLPEELSWPNKLIDLMKEHDKELNVDFYNLALNGSGIFLSIKNLLAFINSIGKPDYIFALFPQMSRSLAWNDTDGFSNVHYEKPLILTDDFNKNYTKNYVHENNLMTNITMINILEQTCLMLGIKLIWSTWRREEEDLYLDCNFNNFFKLKHQVGSLTLLHPSIYEIWHKKNLYYESEYNKKYEKFIKNNHNNEDYFVVARDGQHPGSYASFLTAQDFFNQVMETQN
jgi:hypothetical protein